MNEQVTQPMTQLDSTCPECGQPAVAGKSGTMRTAQTMNNPKPITASKSQKVKGVRSIADLKMAAMKSKMAVPGKMK